MKWSLCEYLCWHWTCYAIIFHLEAEYLLPPFFIICRPASVTFSFSKRFVLFLLLLRQNNNFPSPNIYLLFCFCFPSLGQKKKLISLLFYRPNISFLKIFPHFPSSPTTQVSFRKYFPLFPPPLFSFFSLSLIDQLYSFLLLFPSLWQTKYFPCSPRLPFLPIPLGKPPPPFGQC